MNTVLTMATEWQQTWMATEKCYSQKLLKAKLTTSKQVLSLLFLQRYYNLSKFVLNILNFLKLYHCAFFMITCHLFSWLYISDLTIIISLMFCTGAVETVKSCSSLFLLLANLYFQVVSVLVKTRLFLQLCTSNFP